jgi:beta-glucanase (GH16 family)
VQVANGLLTIEARKERMEDKDFTSGRIRQTGEGFVYGAYVVRARMARGDHLWPALWTLPINNECRYEEIDIAEYRGQPGESHSLETAGHWGRSWDRLSSKGIKHVGLPFDLSQDFHEYALFWLPSKMEWYIDNELYYSVSLEDGFFNSDPEKLPCRGSSTPFDEPTNFIFNLAVGGPFFEEFPNFDPLTWAKPNLELDWVRIYQE